MNKSRALVLLVVTLVASGCAAPVAVTRLSPRDAELALTSSVLTTGKPSEFSQIALRRHALLDRFPKDPAAALAALHAVVQSERGSTDELFALAELSYLHAERGGRPYYLAAAIYSYALLFPGRDDAELDRIDRRTQMAADIYARALAGAFREPRSDALTLAGGSYDLPFGKIEISFDPESLRYRQAAFEDIRLATDYKTKGLRNRYRKAGIGAAVVAHVRAPKGTMINRYASRALRVPATVLLRVERPREALRQTDLHARLEFYPFSNEKTVEIDDRDTPLESEPSVALGMTLAKSRFWKQETRIFLGRALMTSEPSQLRLMEPYRADQIPVVFVHGTNSSSARWADMFNDLENDPQINGHFSFWAFSYMSSRPIALSAAELRSQLTDAVGSLDPEGRNPCLQDMVVIGHSQGGLLTKMTAIDSGDRFWSDMSDKPFESVHMSEQTRRTVHDALFVKPLPFVKRVIFIATPHRGSFLAGPQIVRRLVARLVTLPVDLVKAGAELGAATVGAETSVESAVSLERLPTSIDNMSPGNRFIRTLAGIPLSPSVTANSIIPVKTDGPVEEGNDGVVKYKSAHIDGVESELVVRSPHSVQSNPYAIEEVRRILLEHLERSSCKQSNTSLNSGAKHP